MFNLVVIILLLLTVCGDDLGAGNIGYKTRNTEEV